MNALISRSYLLELNTDTLSLCYNIIIRTHVRMLYEHLGLGFILLAPFDWLDVFSCIPFCYILYCILFVILLWHGGVVLVELKPDLDDHLCPSVLWHCCLGHLTCKNLLLTANRSAVKTVSEMTYNVSSGTLNSMLPLLTKWFARAVVGDFYIGFIFTR